MLYDANTEMNIMPQLMSSRLRGAYAHVIRKAAWRQIGIRMYRRHRSGWGEGLS